jgi:signal transduction histidine kinase/CheY-like chemotaxis protein
MKNRQRMKFGLKMKFTLMISLMISIVGLSLGWYSFYTTQQVLEDEFITRGKSLVMGLAFNSKFGVLSEDSVGLNKIIQGTFNSEPDPVSVEYIRIYDKKQSILAEQYREGEEYHKRLAPVRPEDFAQANAGFFVLRSIEPASNGSEYHYRILAPVVLSKTANSGLEETMTEIVDPQQRRGKEELIGYVELGMTTDPIKDKIVGLIRFYGILTFGVIGVGILGSTLFVGALLRPVKGMVETAILISQGDLSKSVEEVSRDELGQLAQIFNQMTASLRERDAQLQQQFQALQSAHSDLSQTARELELYKDQLEQRVRERTDELAQKNVELQHLMEKAQESDRLKTQFLANMSHELRTPLNAIIGFAQVMLEGIDGEITDVQRTDLTAIYQSGMHLLEMINDVLDIAKIEAGQMTLDLEETRVEDVIQSVMSSVKGLIKGKKIELRTEVEADLPSMRADRTRLRQIILNLVSNAAKFTTKGQILVKAVQESNTMRVSVSDTGMGIRQEDLPKLFKEFRQLDASTTRNQGGTGLGLAIAKRFVELHGGRIWVESQFGVGTTFSFCLPLSRLITTVIPPDKDTAVLQSGDEPDSRLERQGRPVLAVIDDDPLVASLFRRYLESQNYCVVGIDPSNDVVERVCKLKPRVIVLDILMKPKNGWDLLQELKENGQTKQIPIVICSILDQSGKGFALGAVDYLVKPVNKETVLEAVKRLGKIHNVAVIDDDPKAIQLMKKILGNDRYQVQSATDGISGLALIKEQKPDMVFLDLMMPGMDGFDVLEALQTDPACYSIPVVIITAKNLTSEDRERLNGKVVTSIEKTPLTEMDFIRKVTEAFRRAEASMIKE